MLLPAAFVMIAGPQILTSIFLATSEHWARNTAAYIFGAALSITLTVSLAYWLSNGHTIKAGSHKIADVIILVLLVAAMVHAFLARKKANPPKWMGRLETASPRYSFRLGFLLLGLFPGDILTSLAVGAFLASHGHPWWHVLPFVAFTAVAGAAVARRARVRQTRAGLPAQGARLDEHQFLDRQRDRAGVLHRHRHQQPGRIDGHPTGCRPVLPKLAELGVPSVMAGSPAVPSSGPFPKRVWLSC